MKEFLTELQQKLSLTYEFGEFQAGLSNLVITPASLYLDRFKSNFIIHIHKLYIDYIRRVLKPLFFVKNVNGVIKAIFFYSLKLDVWWILFVFFWQYTNDILMSRIMFFNWPIGVESSSHHSRDDCLVVGFTTTCVGKVYSIQNYVIKFVSDLRQVCGFLWILQFPPPIKLTAMI